jgi:hypothetical protein
MRIAGLGIKLAAIGRFIVIAIGPAVGAARAVVEVDGSQVDAIAVALGLSVGT